MHIAAAQRDRGRGCCPRCAQLHATLAAQGRRVRRHRQDRPHPPAGRDAADARPGVLRLRRAGRARRRARSRRRCRSSTSWRTAAPRSAPGSTRIPQFARSCRRQARRRAHRPAVRHRAEQVRGARLPRRAGRSLHGALEDARRRPDQDRQRHPPARLAARARHRRADPAGERAGLLDHARQGQPDAVRGADHGVRAGDRQRRRRSRSPARQGHFELNVYKPVIAYAMLQSIRLLADAATSFDDHCVAASSRTAPRIDEAHRALADAGDRAGAAHRLRQGRDLHRHRQRRQCRRR